MSRAQKGGGGCRTHEDQGVGFSPGWERKARFWSLEERRWGRRGVGKQDMGWRAAPQGCSRLLMILLRMVRSSLTLISMSWGRREDGTHSGERLPLGAPEHPSTTPSLPPLPVV